MEEFNADALIQQEQVTPVQDLVSKIRQTTLPSKDAFKFETPNVTKDLFGGVGMQEQMQKPSFSREVPITEGYDLVGEEWMAKYPTYKQGRDNAEYAGQTQTTTEKWVNGLQKFGAKTFNAVVGGTVGLVYGIEEAITDQKFSSLYDNDFSNWMNDLDTKMNYQLPNYYTKQEQEKGFLGQTTTANFWADKFLGGLSFTAGALISEGIWAWATGGASLATTSARFAPKLARLSKWGVETVEDTAQVLNGMSKYKSLLTSVPGQTYKAGTISKDLALGLGKAGEVGSAIGFMARSAGYEASVEALQFKKEAEEKFYSNFADLNGREPDAEDIAQFEKDLESRANTVFGTNMAILGVSNLAMFGNVLDIKNPIKTGLADFIDRKAFGYGLEKTAEGAFKTIERTGLQKASRFTFNYVAKPAVTEGIGEEGLQGVTTKYNSKWLEHTYDPKLSKETFDSIGAFNEAIGEQYGTKEGWVENGLGILIGIVGGSANAISQGKQDKKELDYKEAMANTWQDKSLQQIVLPTKIQTANRIKGFALEAKDEALKGNIAKSELAKKSGQLAFINGELVMGSSVKDITAKVEKSMETVTPEQWAELGVEDIQQYKENALAEINTLAKEWKTNKKYWQYVIGDKLVGEQNLTFGAMDGVIGNFGKNASIVEALTWQSTIGENANKIMEDVRVSVSNEVGEEHAKTLDALKSIEEVADINAKQLKILQNQNKALKAKRTKLTNQITKLDTLETTDSQKARRAEVTKALLETEEAINGVSKEASDIADKINTFNANKQGLRDFSHTTLDSNFSGTTISSDDILRLDENIAKFQATLQSLELSNPQRAKYLNDLLEEYKQAKDIFLGAQATNRIVSSKDFKLENIGSYIGGKIAKNKAMDSTSQEWLQEVLNDYSKSMTKVVGKETTGEASEYITESEYNDFIDNGNVKQETLNKIAEKVKKNEKLTEKETAIFTDKTKEVNEIIRKGNEFTKQKSQEQINQEKINALEAERRQKLSEVEPIIVEEVVSAPTKSGIEDKKNEIKNKYKLKIIDKGNGFHIQRNGKTISIFNTLQEAEQVLEERINSLIDNIINQPIDLGDNISIDGISVDGNIYSVLNVSERMITIVNIGGVQVPFYLTTGLGGKNLKASWYPMFGYSQSGWLNKTDGKDMEAYYERIIGKENSGILKNVAEKLNKQFGITPNSIKQTGIISAEQTYEAVNSVLDFTPAENQKIDASVNAKDELAKLEENIKSIGDKINTKYDAELKALEQTQPNIEAKKADIERRRQEELDKYSHAITVKSTTYKFVDDNTGIGDTVTEVRVDTKADGSVHVITYFEGEVVSREIVRNKERIADIKNLIGAKGSVSELQEDGTYSDYKIKEDTIIEETENTVPENKKVKEINTKYDAELKALEEQPTQIQQKPTTKTTPNQVEIDKINKEYDAKINALKPKSQNPLEQYKQRLETLLKTRYKDLISVEDETKPTQEEIQTFKDGKADDELKAKLSRWKLYDASIDEDGVSVADLITWINQEETTIEVEDTKDEIEAEDVEQIKDDLEGTNITDDYTLAQNTNGSATIVKPKNSNKYRLAHIKMQTLVDRLGGEFKVLRSNQVKDIKLDKLKPNDVVEVDGMTLTYLSGGQIEINQDDFLSRQQSLNLYIYNSGLNWSYKNLYEVKGNEFVKKASDFAENEVNSEAIYEQKQGDKLTLEIDDVDGFNSTAFGGTKEQLKIYLVDSKGRKVSTLKALREGKLDQDFAVIREEAFKRWEEQGRPSKMKLGIQVETENIFFGSPEIIMSENGTPVNIPITEAGVSQVVATGFIENGEISLNREIKDVSTVFVNKLSKNTSKKVPLVVIKKGAYSIAYPISMVKTATPQTELLEGILQSTVTPQEKVLKINEAIINQNIKTNRLAFDDINNQEKVDEVRKAFEDKKVFVDAKILADKNYKIKNLVNDAQINIDLENLDQAISDAKLRVSYKNTEIKVTLDDKNNNLSEVETELSDLAYELDRDYRVNADTKYLTAKGDIIEDTAYTNAFDDNEAFKAESHLDKMHNVKIIKQAFSEKLSPALEKAIGMDKIRQAKSLIKQYDFLKKQIVVSEQELKEGLKNTDCR